jgi:Ca2+-binding RTX toxin-like protein
MRPVACFDNPPETEYSGSVSRVRLFVMLATGALGLVAIPPAAEGSALRCLGRDATIVGTKQADLLIGTPDRDVIVGLGGNDTILGRGRHDRICGGDGSDRIEGGGRLDWLAGQGGSDTLLGGAGADTLRGGTEADTMEGGRDFIDVPGSFTLSPVHSRASFDAAGARTRGIGAGDDREFGGEGRDRHVAR